MTAYSDIMQRSRSAPTGRWLYGVRFPRVSPGAILDRPSGTKYQLPSGMKNQSRGRELEQPLRDGFFDLLTDFDLRTDFDLLTNIDLLAYSDATRKTTCLLPPSA